MYLLRNPGLPAQTLSALRIYARCLCSADIREIYGTPRGKEILPYAEEGLEVVGQGRSDERF